MVFQWGREDPPGPQALPREHDKYALILEPKFVVLFWTTNSEMRISRPYFDIKTYICDDLPT